MSAASNASRPTSQRPPVLPGVDRHRPHRRLHLLREPARRRRVRRIGRWRGRGRWLGAPRTRCAGSLAGSRLVRTGCRPSSGARSASSWPRPGMTGLVRPSRGRIRPSRACSSEVSGSTTRIRTAPRIATCSIRGPSSRARERSDDLASRGTGAPRAPVRYKVEKRGVSRRRRPPPASRSARR